MANEYRKGNKYVLPPTSRELNSEIARREIGVKYESRAYRKAKKDRAKQIIKAGKERRAAAAAADKERHKRELKNYAKLKKERAKEEALRKVREKKRQQQEYLRRNMGQHVSYYNR